MPATRTLCCVLEASRRVMVSPSVTPTTCPVRVSADAWRGSSRAARRRAAVGGCRGCSWAVIASLEGQHDAACMGVYAIKMYACCFE